MYSTVLNKGVLKFLVSKNTEKTKDPYKSPIRRGETVDGKKLKFYTRGENLSLANLLKMLLKSAVAQI